MVYRALKSEFQYPNSSASKQQATFQPDTHHQPQSTIHTSNTTSSHKWPIELFSLASATPSTSTVCQIPTNTDFLLPNTTNSSQADSGAIPLPAVNTELHHQLEQWRTNLPPAIKFSDPQPATSHPTPVDPSTSIHPSPSSVASPIPASPRPQDPLRPISPAVAVTDAMLRGRHMIAQFHIGRPYLYKALRIPNLLTDDDLEQIKSGLRNAMNWPVTQGIFRKMKSCIPIKFAFCSQ